MIRRLLFMVAGSTAALIAGLGLLVLSEVSARLIALEFEQRRPNALLAAEAYRGEDWLAGYVSEATIADQMEWYPWTYWRRQPFQGRYINIGPDRLRRTWAPDDNPLNRVRIFVLGGSTVWGTAARDEHTIPSYLARALAARGFAPDVVNLGETGYVMKQDLAMLQSRLIAGDVPRVAILYGPYNDVFAAFQNGAAGLSVNELNRRAEFNITSLDHAGEAWLAAAGGLRRVISAAARLIGGTAGRPTPLQTRGPAELAREVIAEHCATRRLVQALGREYGFEVITYVQPVVFTKPQRSAAEQQAFDTFKGLAELFDRVYAGLRTDTACQAGLVRDVSGVFADAAPVFTDQVHPTEAGNRRIADAMIEPLVAVLQQRRESHATP